MGAHPHAARAVGAGQARRRPRRLARSRRLRGLLAETLDDASLELVHGMDGGATWIDADGRGVIVVAGSGSRGHPHRRRRPGVSAVVHRSGLLDDPALAAGIGVAGRLALEHERLHATQRARLAALRSSRARIVEAADAERRRLERDLHDGAQQRIVTLAIGVRLARRRHAADDPVLDEELAAVERELQAAVADLRDLAHGLLPAALDEEGLAAAIEGLAEQEHRLVPGILHGGRCAPQSESAAYFLVSEALRLAPTGDRRSYATAVTAA